MKRIAVVLCLALAACSHLPNWMGGSTVEKPKLPGERTSVIIAAYALDPDESVKAVPFNLPPTTANADWPQHTGVLTAASGNLVLAGSLESEHSATAGEGESFENTLIPRPVTGGGMVFAMDAVGYVSAHDSADVSDVKWQSDGVVEEDEPESMGGGLAYSEGRIYAASGRGLVASLDAQGGAIFWKKHLHIPLRSAPTVAAGKIFVITIDSQVYALDRSTGTVVWSHRGISETAGVMNSVSPTVAGDMVIVPYSSGEVYALSVVDGQELWSQSLAMSRRTLASSVFAGIGGNPVVDGSVVFTVSSGGMLSVLRLADGQRIWDRPIASINTPWVAGDYLFVLTTDNVLVCFVKYDGRVRWATPFVNYEDETRRLYPITWQGPVLAGGKLVLTNSKGELLLVSPADGSVLDTKSVAEGIYTPPVISGGRLYLVNQDATLYSIE